jgi:hypothetical protein
VAVGFSYEDEQFPRRIGRGHLRVIPPQAPFERVKAINIPLGFGQLVYGHRGYGWVIAGMLHEPLRLGENTHLG